jgi:hypothetical protein
MAVSYWVLKLMLKVTSGRRQWQSGCCPNTHLQTDIICMVDKLAYFQVNLERFKEFGKDVLWAWRRFLVSHKAAVKLMHSNEVTFLRKKDVNATSERQLFYVSVTAK